MKYPSLVMTTPPIGSRSILSMDCGPSVDVTMSETAYMLIDRESKGGDASWGKCGYLGCLYVGELCFSACLSFGVGVHHHDGCLHCSIFNINIQL